MRSVADELFAGRSVWHGSRIEALPLRSLRTTLQAHRCELLPLRSHRQALPLRAEALLRRPELALSLRTG